MKEVNIPLFLILISILSLNGQSIEFSNILNDYQDEFNELDPRMATANGDHRFNDKFPVTFTDSHQMKVKAFYVGYLNRLSKVNQNELNRNERLSYDILKWQIDIALKGMDFKSNRIPLTHRNGMHTTLALYGSGSSSQPFKTITDYENWLNRATLIDIWADSVILYFNKGIAEGIVLSRTSAELIIQQLDNLIEDTNNPITSTFYNPIRNIPDEFGKEEKERFRTTYINLINNIIRPSYEKIRSFLYNDYLKMTRTTHGYNEFTNGMAWYNYLIQLNATTTRSPDEIFNIGLSETKRIQNELELVRKNMAFTGTLSDFFLYLNSNPEFFPNKSADEILQAYRSIELRIEDVIKKLFLKMPVTQFEIRQTESFRSASSAPQYWPGLPDGTRPGIFYVPIANPSKVKISESVFLHEAVPGHHFETMLQRENVDLPIFRRFGKIVAFSEGWGLYAEGLGKLLGLYSDPYQYADALGNDLIRSVRLVVDVGLHSKGWTREEAINYMRNNSPVLLETATSEVDRYIVDPGQALAYKIGALKILDLRNYAEQQLHKKFNLQEFHNQILNDGGMPLDILERKILAWIDSY